MRRNIVKKLALAVVVLSVFGFAGCNKDTGGDDGYVPGIDTNSIDATVTHQLFEYDVDTETAGEELSSLAIECYERYKLVFTVEFSGNGLTSLGDDGLNVTINVAMGDYDNEDNLAHLISQDQETGGGPSFEPMGNGVYESHVVLRKDTTTINLERTFFIVGIDSLGNGETSTGYQPVTLSFEAVRPVYINYSESYRITLLPIKGNYDFSEANLSSDIGAGAQLNNVAIAIPERCAQIDLIFWKDETKQQRYGTVMLTAEEYPEEFNNTGRITVVLSDYMKTFVGEERYESEIAMNGSFRVYVEYSAIGGINLNTATVGRTESLL